MSVVALHLYEKLNEAPDDKARSKAIVEAFSELEERFPNLREAATQRDLNGTELRLQKEIEHNRRLSKYLNHKYNLTIPSPKISQK